jgi:hypothetical protein
MIQLTDGVKTRSLCPNCLAIELQENNISFINSPKLIDDISGQPGAVEFKSGYERYVLERRSMMRLISHNLRPIEWKCLVAIYGSNPYMLHDDFYDEEGSALQPIL